MKCIEMNLMDESQHIYPFLARPTLCIGCQFCLNHCEAGAIHPLRT